MKQGKSLVELAQTIEQNKEAKVDYVADTREIVMSPHDSSLQVGLNGGGAEVKPTDHCHNQIATFTGINRPYYEKMREDSAELLAENVNHWLMKPTDSNKVRRMVRTIDGTARAFLSDHYLRVDNEQIAEVALTAFQEVPDIKIVSCDVTDMKLYIKAVFPRTELEVAVGDAVQSGVVISNSEIGLGRFRIDPFTLRLICLNGMTRMQKRGGYSRIHRGSKIDQSDGIIYQQDTIEAATQAIMLQARDAVTTFADPAYFETFVDDLRKAKDTTAVERPVKGVEILGKTIGLSKDEGESVLERLIRAGDYSQYGMMNAVTNLANDAESYDRASELEVLGGKVLDLSPTQWETIAVAA
jgi:hypothetical protein